MRRAGVGAGLSFSGKRVKEMKYQDNNKKFVVLVNSKVELGRQLNAIAHLCFGMKCRDDEVASAPMDHYIGKDGSSHCEIARHPFIILKAKNSNQIAKFRDECIAAGLVYNDFVRQMIASSAEEQLRQTKEAEYDELEYLAICVFGCAEQLKPLTKKFSLVK